MSNANRFLPGLGISAILAGFLLGCQDRKDTTQSTRQVPPQPEITAQSVGLDSSAKAMGSDSKGRLWFKDEATAGRWLYDPKDMILYQATKDASGAWRFSRKHEVDPKSLGLNPAVLNIGKDPEGRLWFEDAAKSERFVYNPETNKLQRVLKNAAGKWEVREFIPINQ